jgi:hypothetical protein
MVEFGINSNNIKINRIIFAYSRRKYEISWLYILKYKNGIHKGSVHGLDFESSNKNSIKSQSTIAIKKLK